MILQKQIDFLLVDLIGLNRKNFNNLVLTLAIFIYMSILRISKVNIYDILFTSTLSKYK